MNIWLLGILIFFARIIDVSIGTLRTIGIVQGRMKMAFFVGLIEISMWLLVLTAVLQKVMQTPILAIFYAVGFSTGNVVGIYIEKKLAMGYTNFRVISSKNVGIIAKRIQSNNF